MLQLPRFRYCEPSRRRVSKSATIIAPAARSTRPAIELSAAQAVPAAKPAAMKPAAQSAEPSVVIVMNAGRGTRCAPAGSETNVRASGSSRAISTPALRVA